MRTKAPPKPTIAIDLSFLTDYLPDFSDDEDGLIQHLTQAFLAAYQQQNPSATVTATLRERAAAFARERAGELISDLSDATRERVQGLVAAALENGDSIQSLARALRTADDLFGTQRSETIARTETAIALGVGQKQAASDMEQDEKAWRGGDCDICQGNGDDGWLDIDDPFSSGDDTIPAHPNCTCTVIYRTARLHEQDAAPVAVVKEARCPQCNRWVGRNVNVGAEIYCPVHKAVLVTG